MRRRIGGDREVRLILLPFFREAQFPGSKAAKRMMRDPLSWKSEFHEAVGEALLDLRELTWLVSTLLVGGKSRAVEDAESWLCEIRTSIREMLTNAREGPFDVFVSSREDVELTDVMDCKPILGRAGLRYPTSLLEFWLKEIHRRGEEIVSLCVQEVSVVDAAKTQSALRKLPYPPG